MNSDDFEKRLERQPIRPIPGEWRREILQQAKANSPLQLKTQNSKLKNFLSELLWPCPEAWAGLAAVWVLILAVNLATREPATRLVKSTPPSHELIMAMKEQRRFYLELVGTPTNEIAEPPKEFTPRPRTERKEEFEIV